MADQLQRIACERSANVPATPFQDGKDRVPVDLSAPCDDRKQAIKDNVPAFLGAGAKVFSFRDEKGLDTKDDVFVDMSRRTDLCRWKGWLIWTDARYWCMVTRIPVRGPTHIFQKQPDVCALLNFEGVEVEVAGHVR